MPRIFAGHPFTMGKYILQIRQRGSGSFKQNDYLYQRCRRHCDPEEGLCLSTQANPCMIAGGEYLRLQAAGLAKETLGDFAIYTFVNTIPYELINSLAYAVGDTILTSNTNNKRSSGSTKKSTGTNGGSNNNSKKTPAPPSSRKGNIRPLTPMDPIINSWNFKNNNFHAW